MEPVPANTCTSYRASPPVLTFPAILDDPMVRTLMQADHVDPRELRSDLSKIAATITVRADTKKARPQLVSICG